jgi:hypothetical protein
MIQMSNIIASSAALIVLQRTTSLAVFVRIAFPTSESARGNLTASPICVDAI